MCKCNEIFWCCNRNCKKRFQYNEKIHFIPAGLTNEAASRNTLEEKQSHQNKNSCCEILKCIFVFLLRFKREIYCHSTINMILYIESQNMYSKVFIFYRIFFAKKTPQPYFHEQFVLVLHLFSFTLDAEVVVS